MYSSLRHGLGNPAVVTAIRPIWYPIEGFEGYGADISSQANYAKEMISNKRTSSVKIILW